MTWGYLGYLMTCMSTLGAAYERGVAYHKVTASFTELGFVRGTESGYVWAEAPVPLGSALIFVIEELFSAQLNARENLTGKRIKPLAVHCS